MQLLLRQQFFHESSFYVNNVLFVNPASSLVNKKFFHHSNFYLTIALSYIHVVGTPRINPASIKDELFSSKYTSNIRKKPWSSFYFNWRRINFVNI